MQQAWVCQWEESVLTWPELPFLSKLWTRCSADSEMMFFSALFCHYTSSPGKGNHIRQDSMEPGDLWDDVSNCRCGDRLKTLEQRAQRQHQRCLAHSLVGTPNYIAPEVLLRKGMPACSLLSSLPGLVRASAVSVQDFLPRNAWELDGFPSNKAPSGGAFAFTMIKPIYSFTL